MRKMLHILAAGLLLAATAQATNHVITNNGFAFSPEMTDAFVGDTITFNLDLSFHPTIQVDSATWSANGATPMAGGFSFTTGSTASTVVTSPGTIFFVCRNHVASSNMKGMIMVQEVATGVKPTLSRAALYPNPAREQLSLPAGLTASQAVIASATGQTVARLPLAQGQRSLPLVDLPAGSYVLWLGERGYRFVKE